jgi:tyrosine-protein kinase Etk/Wzc
MLDEDRGIKKELFEISSFIKQETMINNQVEILRSRSLAQKVLKTLLHSSSATQIRSWVQNSRSPRSQEELFEQLAKRVKISPIRETDVIEIKAQANTPQLASFIANTMADEYYQQSLSASRGEITEVRQFLEDQLEKIQAELKVSEEALKSYQKQQEAVALSEETKELVKQLATFEALHKEAQTDHQVCLRRLQSMKNQLSESKKDLVENVSSVSTPVIVSLRQKLIELETIRAGYLAQGFAADHPKLREVGRRLKDIKQKLAEEAGRIISSKFVSDNPLAYSQELVTRILQQEIELESIQARQEILAEIVSGYNAKLNSLPDKSLMLARLERGAKVNENIFLMLKEKYEEAKIQEAGQIGMVRIVDPAFPAGSPMKPKKKLNLLAGAFLGLFLGWGVALIREKMDGSVKTMEDLEQAGYTVLANIPVIRGKDGFGRKKSHKNESEEQQAKRIAASLVTHFEPKSAVSEAYRTFRTNIQFAQLDKPVKTLLVTSPSAGEGKSTTIANLAITMAQQQIKTVLIDADLRKPVLHSVFGLDRQKGLTHYLTGKAGLEQVIQPTRIENLSLISSGPLPPNPAELLGSQKLRELVERLQGRYEMILFDSPPAMAVTDAVVLSTLLDGAVLVATSGQTHRNSLRYANQALKNVGANLLGVILNRIRMESIYGSYHYYHYYHYRSYGFEEKPEVRV